tara:strand:+ start:725 stop:1516 length:792 start_codon:yes stop_codon:yes gene_type:complete
MHNITFVTGWYNIKSKFDKTTYKKWISFFLNDVQLFYLVIYTNEESYSYIQPYINNSNIKVIIKEFDEFFCYKYDWIANHKNNNLLNENSKFNTDWKLNMLWNEKIHLLNHVINEQIFDTEYYGWCDIGYFRNKNEIVKQWPNKEKIDKLDKTKIYYARVNRNMNELYKYVLNKNENDLPKIPIPPNQVSFAGGFFVLHKDKYHWWNNVYYHKLTQYFQHGYLVKDDQIILSDCILNNLNHFKIIQETNPNKDPWFVFQLFLL